MNKRKMSEEHNFCVCLFAIEEEGREDRADIENSYNYIEFFFHFKSASVSHTNVCVCVTAAAAAVAAVFFSFFFMFRPVYLPLT